MDRVLEFMQHAPEADWGWGLCYEDEVEPGAPGVSLALAGKYPLGYNKTVNTLLRSSDFDEWLSHLGDQKAKARILARLTSATFGNFGDCEPVGEGVSEMRIHVGAGYRIYYTRTGTTVYVLLTGGVKASQVKDIAKAKAMARELKGQKRRRKQ